MRSDLDRLRDLFSDPDRRHYGLVVAGAGLSIAATGGAPTASWKGLLKDGIQRCVDRTPSLPPKWAEYQHRDLESPVLVDLLGVAQKVERLLKDSGGYGGWLKDTVGSLLLAHPEPLSALIALGLPIATTNYDSLIEETSRQHGRAGWGTVTWRDHEKVIDDLSKAGKARHVIHLHGYFEDPDSVVLGVESYTGILLNSSAQSALRAAWTAKQIVFVGFGAGLSDPNFSALLQWHQDAFPTSKDRHFRLVLESELEEVRRLPSTGGIRPVPYGQTHDDLAPFLRSLVTRGEGTGAVPLVSSGPVRPDPRSRELYLRRIVETNRWLELRGLQYDTSLRVTLEKVYVALKVDSTHPYERARYQQAMDRALKRALSTGQLFPAALAARMRQRSGRSERELDPREADGSLTLEEVQIALGSGSLSHEEIRQIDLCMDQCLSELKVGLLRQLASEETSRSTTLTLGEAYRRHRHLVILGDPGSGKTTLARWLALKMARALEDGNDRLTVFTYEVDPATRLDETPFDLGRVRLPIQLALWGYARYRRAPVPSRLRPLAAYLVQQAEELAPGAGAVLLEALERGQALILMDGLDEVPALEDRDGVVRDVHEFLERYDIDDLLLRGSRATSLASEDLSEDPDLGNRLIITSRIAGNFASRLSANLPRLTIEPMTPEALEHFCHSWMEALYIEEARRDGTNADAARARAALRAEGLMEAIRTRPAVMRMALNPQLAGVLAAVYQREKGRLPEHRVELYDIAIRNLTESWERRPERSAGLNRHEIFEILEPVAELMHSRSVPIREAELREILIEQLAQVRGTDPRRPGADLRRSVDEFLLVIRKDVGLLAAFGDEEYRFLHRSFQEYLAARSLVRDLGRAAARLLEKIDDPLWREPVLMALGYLSFDRPAILAEIVLEILRQGGRLEDLLPRSTFLIVDALTEMDLTEVGDEKTILDAVVDRLIGVYSDRRGLARFDELREAVEKAITRLREGGWERQVAARIRASFAHGPKAPAVASLLRRLQWLTPAFVQGLQEALPGDSADWGWPIDGALRDAVGLGGSPGAPTAPLTPDQIDLRLEAELDSDLLERVIGSPESLRLAISLFGGYQDFGVAGPMREYYEIAAYLQLRDGERSPFMIFFGERWGEEDPVYNMAVHLDTMPSTKAWKVEPRFQAEAIYRNSPIGLEIIISLQEGRNLQRLELRLLEMWQTDPEPGVRSEALIGLLALGRDVALQLSDVGSDAVAAEAARRFRDRTAQLATALRDPVVRAGQQMLEELKASPPLEADAIVATLAVLMANGAFPVDTLDLRTGRAERDQAALIAEFLGARLIGSGDFPIKNAEEALDEVSSAGLPVALFLRSLVAVSKSRQLHWAVPMFGWRVERLPLCSIDEGDVPLAALTAIENTHHEISMIRTWALTGPLAAAATINPDLLPELLALNFADIGDRSQRRKTFDRLAPALSELVDPREAILELALAVRAPYRQARALWRLARHFPARRKELLQSSLEAARKEPHAQRRAQILERLASEGIDGAACEALAAEALAATHEVQDADDRARLFARLAFHIPVIERREVLRLALEAARQIAEERRRAETLLALRPVLRVFPELATEARRAEQEIIDPLFRALAQNRPGVLLRLRHPEFATRREGSPHVWAPIVLSALLLDIRTELGLSSTVDDLWDAFRIRPAEESLQALQERAGESRLLFSLTAALVLDHLLDEGHDTLVYGLLPLLSQPDPETLPVLRRWLREGHGEERRYAALFLAEIHGLSPEAVPEIVALLESRNDVARHRASRVIHHPAIVPEAPTRPVSVLGRSTIDTLHREAIRHRSNPAIALRISWLNQDLLHDSPEEIRAWTAALARGGPDVEIARMGVSYIQGVTEAVWDTLLEELAAGPPVVKIAIVEALSRLAYRMTTEWGGWAQLATISETLDYQGLTETRFLRGGIDGFVSTALGLARKLSNESPERIAGKAEEELLEELGGSYESLLRQPDPEALRTALNTFADEQLYVNNDKYFASFKRAVEPLREEPSLLRPLLIWLVAALRTNVRDNSPYWLRSNLLLTLAAAAQVVPLAFSDLTDTGEDESLPIDPSEFEHLLVAAARRHNAYPGRAAALRLLGSLSRVSHQVADAIRAAMLDADDVRQAALAAARRMRAVDGDDLLPRLMPGLRDESALACYSMAQLLSSVATSSEASLEQRREILAGLAEAIRDPSSRRYVHFYWVDAKVPSMPRLDKAFYSAIMRIAGLL